MATPKNIARELNAAMSQMFEERGLPCEAAFNLKLNAMIAIYPDGPIVVRPIPLSAPPS